MKKENNNSFGYYAGQAIAGIIAACIAACIGGICIALTIKFLGWIF